MKVGEIWRANGLWQGETPSLVRIEEILETGSVDVNYELDINLPKDLRILPPYCMIEKVENEKTDRT